VSAARSVTLDVPDPAVAEAFYKAAFGPDIPVAVRAGDAPTSGFRGYTLSVVVPAPSGVDAIVASALDAGATVVKPVAKSFWGYGGVVQAPDGAIWTVASSSKKDTGPATAPVVESVVLLLGVADVKAAKQIYVDRGLVVARSFGSKYVEFTAADRAPVTLALQGRRALAKNAGVDPDGTGSRRLVIVGDAGSFTDPDGFVWETSA
jgi:hypothetical protein